MRILKREKNAVTLKVDNNDDLWVLSHIVKKGDIISGKTTRKIEYESEKERKPVFIKIEVEKVEYAGNLRISGIVINELEDVSKGEHHTFNVEPGSTITIEKEWKKYEVERLMRAVKDTEKPNVLLVAMEPGSAVFGLLSRKGVKIVGEINIDIPGKRYQREQEKRINEFYSKVKATLKQLKDIYNVKHTVIGTLSAHKPTVEKELGAKVVTVSHVGKNALFEMVKQGAIDRVVKEERLKKEIELVEEVFKRISKNGLIAYGDDVQEAVWYGAVDTLIVTDKFISNDRDKAERMMRMVEEKGGKVEIISSDNDYGSQVDGIGGIAALLRFRLS